MQALYCIATALFVAAPLASAAPVSDAATTITTTSVTTISEYCKDSTIPHSAACMELWLKEAGCLGLYGTFFQATTSPNQLAQWIIQEDINEITSGYDKLYEASIQKNATKTAKEQKEDVQHCLPMDASQRKCFSALTSTGCQKCLSPENDQLFENRLMVDTQCAQGCLGDERACPTFQGNGDCLSQVQHGPCKSCIHDSIVGGKIVDKPCFNKCVQKHASDFKSSCPVSKTDDAKEFDKYVNGLLAASSDPNTVTVSSILYYETSRPATAKELGQTSADNDGASYSKLQWDQVFALLQKPENANMTLVEVLADVFEKAQATEDLLSQFDTFEDALAFFQAQADAEAEAEGEEDTTSN